MLHPVAGQISERPPALPVNPFEGRTLVEIGLAPDPWLVSAAHLGFHCMNPADISYLFHAAQKGADRDVLTSIGMAHLERDYVPEISGRETGAGNGCTVLHECNKPAQDVGPPLLYPEEHVRLCWRNTGTEDPAAEPALLTRFVIRYLSIHAVSPYLFFRHPDKSMYRICSGQSRPGMDF